MIFVLTLVTLLIKVCRQPPARDALRGHLRTSTNHINRVQRADWILVIPERDVHEKSFSRSSRRSQTQEQAALCSWLWVGREQHLGGKEHAVQPLRPHRPQPRHVPNHIYRGAASQSDSQPRSQDDQDGRLDSVFWGRSVVWGQSSLESVVWGQSGSISKSTVDAAASRHSRQSGGDDGGDDGGGGGSCSCSTSPAANSRCRPQSRAIHHSRGASATVGARHCRGWAQCTADSQQHREDQEEGVDASRIGLLWLSGRQLQRQAMRMRQGWAALQPRWLPMLQRASGELPQLPPRCDYPGSVQVTGDCPLWQQQKPQRPGGGLVERAVIWAQHVLEAARV